MDISLVGIAKAKKRGSAVKYAALDILKQPLPEKYDFITIVQTLEHFDDPFPVIEKCLDSTRKSLIIIVPFRQLCGKDQDSLQGQSFKRSEHRYSFDRDTFSCFDAEVVRVTEYIEEAKARCIIYRIGAAEAAADRSRPRH